MSRADRAEAIALLGNSDLRCSACGTSILGHLETVLREHGESVYFAATSMMVRDAMRRVDANESGVGPRCMDCVEKPAREEGLGSQ